MHYANITLLWYLKSLRFLRLHGKEKHSMLWICFYNSIAKQTKYGSFLHDNVHGIEKKINSAWSTLMLVALLLQPIHSRWYDGEKERKCKGL